jgi:putative transposase
MPRKSKRTSPAPELAPVPDAVLNAFAPRGCSPPPTWKRRRGASRKALIERALGAELSHHLGYPPGADKPADTPNYRNGSSEKTVLTEDGPLPIAIPRDRAGTFEPLLIGRHVRRFTGFDDKILTLYARG